MKTRLQKLMAEANIASRRGAEELIEQGRVRLNGKVATLGDKADLETDVVEVDGVVLRGSAQKKVYFALYKPRQVLTTSLPHRGDERRTVLDFIPYTGHLFTIGRLDADSEGLVVLTNDGELTQRLTHPRFHHTKTYRVTVHGLPTEETLERWQNGVWLEDEGRTAPCSVTITKGSPKETVLRIVMTEGKKRQIRRVALALGHPVQQLVRTHIGMLSVEGLRPGEWRELTPRDVHELKTPSPILKELKARRWEQRRAEQSRSASRSQDERPRRSRDDRFERRPRRSLVDEPGERRPRRSEGISESDERPRRSYGERSAKPSGDRPRRPFTESEGDSSRSRAPRRDSASGDRPRRSFAKPEGEFERPRRSRSEQAQTGGSRDEQRPRRSFKRAGDERDGERPRRPFAGSEGDASRSRGPRRESAPDDRPRRPRGDSEGRGYEGTRAPRSSGEFSPGDDRPRRPRSTSGSSGPQGDRPRRPRSTSGSGGPQGDRPRRPRPSGERPDSSRPDSDRPRRSFRDSAGSEDRPARKPFGKDSGGQDRPKRTRSPRPDDNREGDRPRGGSRRPAGGRSGAPRTERGGDAPQRRSPQRRNPSTSTRRRDEGSDEE